MNRLLRPIAILSGLAALAIASTHLSGRVGASQPKAPPGVLVTNDGFISALYSDLDLEDPKAVFRHVFRALPDEVTVYPSEGYYYFRFPARGLTITGSISLSALDRDEGILGFGYVGRSTDSAVEHPWLPAEGEHSFSRADGLLLTSSDPFTYSARFEGRAVVFRLYDPGIQPPQTAKLRGDEVFVGRSFDESGLQFLLIFNQSTQRLFWVLDEDGFVPELLTVRSENVAVGQRTGFAFYLDRSHDRKILCGVQRANVRTNNWYDGPFDQLPDTQVKLGNVAMRKYLMAHYDLEEVAMDIYGNYAYREGSRVAVAPYRVYGIAEELSFIEDLAAELPAGPELYAALTEQIY